MSKPFQDETLLARWLSGELSAAEQAELEAHADFPAWKAIVEEVAELEPDLPPVSSNFEQLQAKLPLASVRQMGRRRLLIWGAAASVLLLVGLNWWWQQQPLNFQTALQEQQRIDLPDGSVVRLNAESQLQFKQGRERIAQLSGEAWFKVASGIPFRVQTTKGDVRVLGTSFNVYVRDDILEVRCWTGRVEVQDELANFTRVLTKGQAVRLRAHEEELSWTFDDPLQEQPLAQQSSFEQVPLSRVMAELVRQYDITFIFSSSEIPTEDRYTGYFPHGNLLEALQTVFDPMGVEAKVGRGKAIILEMKKKEEEG
jgi:ferric-dicitrate binding protein FerR (iron transport regulator)